MNDHKLTTKKNNQCYKDHRSTFLNSYNKKLNDILLNGTKEEEYEFILKSMPYIKKHSQEYTMSKKTGEINEEKKETNTIDTNNNVSNIQATLTTPNTIEKYIIKSNSIKRGAFYKEFMENVLNEITIDDTVPTEEDDIVTTYVSFKCTSCKSNLTTIPSENLLVCQNCGLSNPYQDFSTSSQYYKDVEILSHFAYKRINHFREWLTQIQAKESTVIPEDVILKILKEIKKERIQSSDDITISKIKKYLKTTGYSKYYEHIPIIINKICNKQPLVIDNDTERVLIRMFKMIQAPFEKHCPPTRKNFLSYSYTLYKLCELIGRKDLLPLFSLLKSREKLFSQDKIWKNICIELNWTFIQSL